MSASGRMKESVFRLLNGSDLMEAVVLRRSSGAPIYNAATATTIYNETELSTTAYRGTVTEKQAASGRTRNGR